MFSLASDRLNHQVNGNSRHACIAYMYVNLPAQPLLNSARPYRLQEYIERMINMLSNATLDCLELILPNY